jgi:hypothetical protein
MPCPGCLRDLTTPPDPSEIWKPGDLYCLGCSWLFAVEITRGQDPLATLSDVLRCPAHDRGRLVASTG